MPRSSLATCQCAWLGSIATSNVALLTSIPTCAWSSPLTIDPVRPNFRTRPDLADASSPPRWLRQLSGLGTAEARRPSWGTISWITGLLVCLARWRSATVADCTSVIQGLLALDLGCAPSYITLPSAFASRRPRPGRHDLFAAETGVSLSRSARGDARS